ncbi:MAG: hypothetical protein JWO35_561 [Candidatus Saccharibacteria bacterium]|nr:hypothetical protein [Candidatus Saccharibacteria bacterium]
MGPEAIKKITDAKLNLEHAQNRVTSTNIEVNQPILKRYFELHERYEACGISREERAELGHALKQRVEDLVQGLWDQEAHSAIKPAFKYLDKETKSVKAPGFVDMYLTRYTGEGPDFVQNKPAGHLDLEDENGYWKLYHNSVVEIVPDLDYPMVHARLEDDVATLETMFAALELPTPEVA